MAPSDALLSSMLVLGVYWLLPSSTGLSSMRYTAALNLSRLFKRCFCYILLCKAWFLTLRKSRMLDTRFAHVIELQKTIADWPALR